MLSVAAGRAARPAPLAARVGVSATLVAVEFLVLSVLFDLPTSGPALPLVEAIRVLVPVLLGAVGAGVILAGPDVVRRLATFSGSLPPWRPFPWIVLQLGAFTALALSARALLGRGAPPLDPHLLAGWLAAAAATALLGVAVALPPRWVAHVLLARAGAPLLALATGLLVWRGAAAAEATWGTLSGPTLHAVAALLTLVGAGPDVDVAERIIGVGDFYVRVAPVCSGANGLGLVLVFVALWLTLGRGRLRFPRALALLPLGAIAAFGANAVRLAALLVLGASGAEEIAVGGFHSKAGWILFLAVALGLVALAERWHWLHDPDVRTAGSAPAVPEGAAAHLAPLLAMLAAALATGALAAGALDRLYGARVLAGLGALWLLRRGLPRPTLSPASAPIAIGVAVGAAWCLVAGGAGGAARAVELRTLGTAEQAAWLAARVLGAVVVVPVVEELAFRGFLLPWLAAPTSSDAGPATPRAWPWAAALVSSAAFGALHANFLLGSAAGLAFAWVRLRRGRLSDAVLAHAVANAAVALAVLAFGRWDLWS